MVVIQAADETFYRRMAEQPSTFMPDSLSQSPRAIEIEAVDDQKTYQDDEMSVELYHVADSQHSSSLLRLL